MANTEEERILDIKVRYDDAIKAIANYKEKIDSLKSAEKQLAQQVRDGKITMGEYNKSVAANDAVMTQYKENMRVLKKELQNNIRQEQAMEGSLKQLRAELSNATKAYDELSRAERNGAKGKELQQHIKDITKELKGAEEETDRFYRNVGNYKNSIAEALTGNNQFASSLLKMAQDGGGIKGVFTNIVGSVKAFGAALMGLLSNPVFLGIAGIAGAGAAFKWFYDYNEGLAEATKLTKEFTGLQGDELVSVRNSIQATADTFGKDYKDTLATVDNLMANFGLTAQEAIKVVNDGFVAGADLNGDMLQQIQQFGPAFHDAGISASQLVAIISQTRSGIFSKDGMVLIQTASMRIRQMSTSTAKALDAIGISSKQVEADLSSGAKSTFDVIKEISQRLQQVPKDSQAVGDILKDVFGRQGANAGMKMVAELGKMTTSIDDVKKVTGEYGELQEEQIKASEELNGSLSALFDMTDKGWDEMILQVKILATKWLTALIKGVIKVINYFIDLYNQSTVFRGAVQAIAVDFKNAWEVIKLVFNLIIDGFKSVGRGIKGLATTLEGLLTLSLDKIKQGLSELGNGYLATIHETIGDIKTFGKNTANNFYDGFSKTLNSKPVAHIKVQAGISGSETAQSGYSGGGGTTYHAGAKSGSGAKSTKNNSTSTSKTDAARQQEEAAKAERDAIQKAQELMIKLIEDNYEQRRAEINASYDKQISDIEAKLNKGTKLTSNTIAAYYSQIGSLEQLRDRELAVMREEHIKKQIEQENRRISFLLQAAKKGSEDEKNLKIEQLNNQEKLDLANAESQIHNTEQLEAMKLAIQQSYAAQRKQVEIDTQKAMQEAQLTAIQNDYSEKINAARDNELTQLQLKMEQRKAILDMAQQQEGESTEAFNARKLQMEEDYQSSLQAVEEKQLEVEKTKASVVTNLFSGLSDVADAFGENSKTLARASKVLALGEIAISSGVAVAQGIKQAQSVPFPANIAAIATTVATILGGIASAIKTVKSAKFAHGGYVSGAGSGTSDSIPARLSNGESVLTAKATSLFAPALSAFNQLGGGVPIVVSSPQQQIGQEFIASAIARGMQMAPRQVVSVEEISDTKNRIDTIENLSTL